MINRLLLSNNMARKGFTKIGIPRICNLTNKNYNVQKIFYKSQKGEIQMYDKFKVFAIKYKTRHGFLMREI